MIYVKKQTKAILYTMPAVIFIAGTILLGTFLAILQSFGYFPEINLTKLTLKYYQELFKSPTLVKSLVYSFKTAIISTLLGVGCGLVASYAIVTGPKEHKFIKRMMALPVAIPHIIVVTIVFNLLIRTGFISRLLIGIGLLSSFQDFPNLLLTSSGIGVIVVYFWKAFPYTMMVLYSVLKSIDKRYNYVSRNLGATRLQFFFYVVLPLAKPMLITSALILFAFSFSAYEVPYLLGAIVPKALPVQAYIEYTSPILENRPYAMAINVLMMIITFFLMGVYQFVSTRVERRRYYD